MATRQAMEALNEANRVRVARAALKKEIRSLPKEEAVAVVCDVVTGGKPDYSGMPLLELFGAIPQVSHRRSERIVRRMRFPFRTPKRRICELTDHQRRELADGLREEVCSG